MDLTLAGNLAVAALGGLAVGVEREWSGHTQGPDARFAGVRTFTMLGGLGGMTGFFLGRGQTALAVTLFAAASALVVTAFVVAMRRPGVSADSTTEVAALVVLALGVLAGIGERALAGAGTALVVVALAEKSRVQRWLALIDEGELRAALQFAVLALVILPLLPGGAYGPYASVRPRELWVVVLLFSGLNFLGYVARRVVGVDRGYSVTGLLGGLVSSTAVTLHFSRQSRVEPVHAAALGVGVVAACTVLVPRVVLVASLLVPALGLALLPVLAPTFVVGCAVIVRVLWRARRHGPDDHRDASMAPLTEPAESRNPLGLARALQMAAAFQVVLVLLAWVQANVGLPGVLTTAAVLGLTDVDALTLSMARLSSDAAQRSLAATAIGVGVLSNTLLKLGLTLALGAPAFRRRASAGLALLAVASGVGLALEIWLRGP
jgi:uncharacterized membrane protein (DUF4010 family)